MSRLVQTAVSHIAIIGYLLAVTWGQSWHDHQHGHSQAHEDCEMGHAHCCSHHHAKCAADSQEHAAPFPAPCHSPWHDDDCVVCKNLAHPPLAAPVIALAEASEPIPAWVSFAAPLVTLGPVFAYDSRGPPSV